MDCSYLTTATVMIDEGGMRLVWLNLACAVRNPLYLIFARRASPQRLLLLVASAHRFPL
jgi:hypothetical protein